jgi:hypothetical protein
MVASVFWLRLSTNKRQREREGEDREFDDGTGACKKNIVTKCGVVFHRDDLFLTDFSMTAFVFTCETVREKCGLFGKMTHESFNSYPKAQTLTIEVGPKSKGQILLRIQNSSVS